MTEESEQRRASGAENTMYRTDRTDRTNKTNKTNKTDTTVRFCGATEAVPPRPSKGSTCHAKDDRSEP